MKKLVAIVAVSIVSLASFGQGYFNAFGSSVKGVWDGFSSSSNRLGSASTAIDIAFLFGTGTPGIQTTYSASSPTNGVITYSATTAWTDLLGTGAGNYILATNASTGLLVTATTNPQNGTSAYLSSATFDVTNSVAAATYNLIIIGWSSAYATPQLADQAGAAVGWDVITGYATTLQNGQPASITSDETPFGVDAPAATPEPATIALAGMGIASLLAFRRRSSK